jgi:bifunctional DNase/RNase
MDDTVEVQLFRVIIQEKSDHQYIHLRERSGERSFPIVIGFNEAWEIHRKLRKIKAPRPMTHDLIGRLIRELEHRLRRIIITELKDSTFYAVLVLGQDGAKDERMVDCRPSDAIALAVQTGAPIFVSRKVLDVVAPA